MLSELLRRGNHYIPLITGTFAFTKCNKTMLLSLQQLRGNSKKLGITLSKCDAAHLIS